MRALGGEESSVMEEQGAGHRRILIVDENAAIHEDFRRILCPTKGAFEESSGAALDALESLLFGDDFSEILPERRGLEVGAQQNPYELSFALQGQEALRRVEDAVERGRPYALAFIDIRMPPGWDGIETSQHLWRVDPDLEVVLCTAYSDVSWDELVERLDDASRFMFMKKPFDVIEARQIARALTEKWRFKRRARMRLEDCAQIVEQRTRELRLAYEEVLQLNARLRERETQLERLSTHDDLTGLPNRAFLLERLRRRLSIRWPGQSPCALFCIDIDHFSRLNDTRGHAVGDRLLLEVAERLKDALHHADTVARLGSDTFAVLLDNLENRQEAQEQAHRLHGILSRPIHFGDLPYSPSVSIGIAFEDAALPEEGEVATQRLMREADLAMSEACRRLGPGNTMVFETEAHSAILTQMTLEQEFGRALERDEFVLYYQPILRIAPQRVSGAEALVRWRHPRRGLLSPGAFIQMAEESGQIVALGRWVLREACRQMMAWRGEFPRAGDLWVSVNLSARQLARPELFGEVTEALAAAGAPARALRVEIVETAVIDEFHEARRNLERLQAHGISIALDDFGTGYSSLSLLNRMPLDCLKIDRSFVNGVTEHERSATLARAIVEVGHSLGMTVVAEGVEEEDQLGVFRALRCDLVQGYLFAKPLPPAEFAAYLARAQ